METNIIIGAKRMDFSNMDRGQITLIGAGVCTMLSMHFTIQLLSQHLFYWKNPKEQKVIAKFMALMYSYLNISISKNIVPDEIKGREIHHSFPMTLFQPHVVRLDHTRLKQLKHWTWQFCGYPPCIIYFNDNVAIFWDTPQLVELDVYHHYEHLGVTGFILLCDILPCICKGVGASLKVLVHQRHRLFLFLAGYST
ncbi:unnamed protein product [Rhodiola kirilowii]